MRTLIMLVTQYPLLSAAAAIALLCGLSPYLLGAVLIRERQVGIVRARLPWWWRLMARPSPPSESWGRSSSATITRTRGSSW